MKYDDSYYIVSLISLSGNVVFNEAIGFTAIHGYDASYSNGEVVIFGNVVSNIGNHYSPTNSTFTCPIAGMYMFSVSVLNGVYDSDSEVAIMRDDSILINVLLDESSSDDMFNSASAVIVVECDIGQHVYVESIRSSAIEGNFGTSHFSGALIQRL